MELLIGQRERRALQGICRRQCVEARLYRRARIVLLAASGHSISSIARRVGSNRLRVGQWIRRFEDRRLAGLADLARAGRPIQITPLERHQVIAAACHSPRDFGLERAVWTHDSLRSAVISAKFVRAISTSEVGRILEEAQIKPHHIRMWCHSTDPAFQEKMRAIVRLYVERPAGEPVLCIDEKTGMQALSRSRELQLPEPGRSARFEFEYKRHGTRCLFACFNVGTGKVIGRCTKARKRPDFFSFMDEVASVYRHIGYTSSSTTSTRIETPAEVPS